MYFCRYPTNKWLKLGTFHARDERTVQSFPLDEHLYAKYVKVSTIFFFCFVVCLNYFAISLFSAECVQQIAVIFQCNYITNSCFDLQLTITQLYCRSVFFSLSLVLLIFLFLFLVDLSASRLKCM